MLSMQPRLSRSTRPSFILAVIWANWSVRFLSSRICAVIWLCCLFMRLSRGDSSSYESLSSGCSRSRLFSGSTMRFDRRFASMPDSTSAAMSTIRMGWRIPSISTPIVARLTDMRSTLPSVSLWAQYMVFSRRVEE